MSFWRSSDTRYSTLAKLLHWGCALMIFGLFGLGWWMVRLDYYHGWYQRGPYWHIGLGVVLVSVMMLRLIYRGLAPYPAPIATHPRWVKVLAKLVHLLLYALVLLMLVTGYLVETAKGDPLRVFDWLEIPSLVSGITNLEDRAGDIHEWAAYSIMALVALHVAGALKHHFIDRDGTLMRMITQSKQR